MREGGVYADIDILLQTDLDELITPTMSFFIPRDAVAEFAESPYCLWNGLMGSSPGHPFVVRATERVVNFVLNRADLNDLESDLCQYAGRDVEIWKTRSAPVLLMSGPCGMGVAVNEVLGRNPLSKYDVGWMNWREQSDKKYSERSRLMFGDVMILVVSRITSYSKTL